MFVIKSEFNLYFIKRKHNGWNIWDKDLGKSKRFKTKGEAEGLLRSLYEKEEVEKEEVGSFLMGLEVVELDEEKVREVMGS